LVQKLPPVNDPALKPWARKIEEILLTHESAISGVRTNSARQGQQVTGLAEVVAPTVKAVTQVPQAPQNVVGTAVWSWTATGSLSVTLEVTWDAVTLDLNDGVVTSPFYEIWVRTADTPGRRVSSTEDTHVDVPGLFTYTDDYYVSVRAVTRKGANGQFSSETLVPHPSSADLPMPEAPSAPVLSTAFGVVAAHWDGLTASGAGVVPYFAHVSLGVSATENGSYSFVGQQLQSEGNIVASDQPVGDTLWYQLYAVDYLGRVSPGSTPVSITVEGVDLGPLQQDLEDAQASVAQAQADVLAAQQDIAGMQDDVSDALTGPVDGTRIVARSVTADKVVISDTTNNIADPDFSYGAVQWNLPNGSTIATITDPPAGVDATKALQVVASGSVLDAQTITPIPVRPGQQWYAEMWIRRIGSTVDTTGTIQLAATINRPAANGGPVWPTFVTVTPADITTTWQRLSGVVTIPDFGTSLQVRPSIRADVADGTFQMTEFVLRRMVGGELLVDGTITATKIATNSITSAQMAANSISAEELAAGAVVAEKISAEAVTANAIAAGAIQTNHIAAGSITTTHLAAGLGGQLDITANQAITLVAGKADAAQSTATSVTKDLADMQTVYNFGSTGATISSPSSTFSLALKSDRIEFQANGNPVSTWTSGQMKVDSFVGTTVELGNHKLEKYGTGGTVVRALN
jgi:hypothetical protein